MVLGDLRTSWRGGVQRGSEHPYHSTQSRGSSYACRGERAGLAPHQTGNSLRLSVNASSFRLGALELYPCSPPYKPT